MSLRYPAILKRKIFYFPNGATIFLFNYVVDMLKKKGEVSGNTLFTLTTIIFVYISKRQIKRELLSLTGCLFMLFIMFVSRHWSFVSFDFADVQK